MSRKFLGILLLVVLSNVVTALVTVRYCARELSELSAYVSAPPDLAPVQPLASLEHEEHDEGSIPVQPRLHLYVGVVIPDNLNKNPEASLSLAKSLFLPDCKANHEVSKKMQDFTVVVFRVAAFD